MTCRSTVACESSSGLEHPVARFAMPNGRCPTSYDLGSDGMRACPIVSVGDEMQTQSPSRQDPRSTPGAEQNRLQGCASVRTRLDEEFGRT